MAGKPRDRKLRSALFPTPDAPTGSQWPKLTPVGAASASDWSNTGQLSVIWHHHISPFFLQHYEPLVDRIVSYDDGSTDRSIELLRASPKVEVRLFRRDLESYLDAHIILFDSCWKGIPEGVRAEYLHCQSFDAVSSYLHFQPFDMG